MAILDKYQIALTLGGHAQFSAGTPPYQDCATLIALRNTLTHYKPVPYVLDEGVAVETDKLEQRLRGRYPGRNPFVQTLPRQHFLDAYLCHDCAAWAVESTLALTREFFARMGIEQPYEKLRHLLLTE